MIKITIKIKFYSFAIRRLYHCGSKTITDIIISEDNISVEPVVALLGSGQLSSHENPNSEYNKK